jgi:hypothetical protein
MTFYTKGDVRIHYEEVGPVSRFWSPPAGA